MERRCLKNILAASCDSIFRQASTNRNDNHLQPAIMLDAFEIVTTSGVVLWSKSYAPIGAGLINNLIKDVFIEEKAGGSKASESAVQKPTYKKDGYTLKWTTSKDLGLIFVVCASFLFL